MIAPFPCWHFYPILFLQIADTFKILSLEIKVFDLKNVGEKWSRIFHFEITWAPSKCLIFDTRTKGAGILFELWPCLFTPKLRWSQPYIWGHTNLGRDAVLVFNRTSFVHNCSCQLRFVINQSLKIKLLKMNRFIGLI